MYNRQVSLDISVILVDIGTEGNGMGKWAFCRKIQRRHRVLTHLFSIIWECIHQIFYLSAEKRGSDMRSLDFTVSGLLSMSLGMLGENKLSYIDIPPTVALFQIHSTVSPIKQTYTALNCMQVGIRELDLLQAKIKSSKI
jgi:hypothetical protein